MPSEVPLIVFTDLDGTLLDHETYRWGAAKPALAALQERGVPVVLTSSKTAREICQLQEDMGLTHWPAIVENGAGVIGLEGTRTAAADYAALRAALDMLPTQLRTSFTGFGDMSAKGVATLTGLSPDAARAAHARQFSEPGLWAGGADDKRAFLQALRAQGIEGRQGGRFLTLSFGRTKADGMAEVIEHFRPKRSIALGDAPNDVEMLEAADTGVIVANPHGPTLPTLKGEAEGRIIRTEAPGPEGWNSAVLSLI